MGLIADTNKVSLSINEEGTWGETPSSVTVKRLRFTGESLAFSKQSVTSETIRDDRMRDQVALVGFNTEGDMEYEFAAFDYDDLLEGVLFGTWANILSLTGTTIAATSTGFTDSGNGLGQIPINSYVWVSGFANKALNRRYKVTASAAGSITTSPAPAATQVAGSSYTIKCNGKNTAVSASNTCTVSNAGTITFGGGSAINPSTYFNIVPGQFIRLYGFANAANNGVKRVASVSSTAITLAAGHGLTNESVADATVVSVLGRMLRNGVTSRSYHVHKGFTDINQYISFRGMRVGSMSMEAAAGEIITGAFSFMGKTVEDDVTPFYTTIIDSTVSPVMTGSAHIGSITQNGTAIAAGIKTLSLEVENNLRIQNQIGSTAAYGIGTGFQDISGQIEVYFEDMVIYDQLINHTATELSWRLTDDVSNIYQITVPSVLFTEGYPTAGGGNDDVMIPMGWQAIRNSTYNCQIQIDMLPALA